MPKRLNQIESDKRRKKIVQDLVAGFSNQIIADRHGITVRMVQKIRQAEEENLRALHEKELEKRQKKIDKFLEDELSDLMDLCRSTTKDLMESIKKVNKTVKSGAPLSTTEESTESMATDDKGVPVNKTVKVKGILEVDLRLKLWREAHRVLASLQKGDDDVPGA